MKGSNHVIMGIGLHVMQYGYFCFAWLIAEIVG